MNGIFTNLVLSFGGNQLTTASCFEKSVTLLADELGKQILISKIYESEPWGFEQPTHPFLNQIVVFATKKEPKEVLEITQNIEKKLGRKTKSTNKQYTDRPIDIDILFYGKLVLDSEKLTIPHSLITKRKFILEPLNEILPNFIHPIHNKSAKELLLQCEDNLTVHPIKKK